MLVLVILQRVNPLSQYQTAMSSQIPTFTTEQRSDLFYSDYPKSSISSNS